MPSVVCSADALVIRTLPEVRGDTDSGKRLINDQRALVYGHSLDDKWLFVDAPAGRGWASAQFLVSADTPVLAASPLPSAAWPHVPNGLAAIKALFGEPGSPMCHAGRVKLAKPLPLSWSPKELISEFACHKLVEDVMQSVYDEINRRGFWDLLEDFGGCYEYRDTRGSSHLSTHAWGITNDLNANANPLGAASKMPVQIVGVFKDHGFVWGGEFSGRKDPMHFQYATGY